MRGRFFKQINTDAPDNVQFTSMVKLVPNEMQVYALTHIPLSSKYWITPIYKLVMPCLDKAVS